MNDQAAKGLDEYFRGAETWSQDRERASRMTVRGALIIAAVAAFIAVLEAIALIYLMPLKTVVPYTLLVDRQTGYVQALKPLERDIIAPDTALTRSFLAQYVIAREGFDIEGVQEDYRKVALLSAGEARDRYISQMQASNPASPFASLPKRTIVNVQLRSLVSLNNSTALVHFSTVRVDPGAEPQPPQLWAAVIKYRYSSADMSAADRLTNPLGFQVVHYRKTAEIPPSPAYVAPTPEAPNRATLERGAAPAAPAARPAP